MFFKYLTGAFLLMLCVTNGYAQNIQLTIKGVKSSKGQLLIGIFKDNEGFRKEQAFKHLQYAKSNVSNGTLSVAFTLEPGVYGISLLDDENSNGKMDYNMVKIPKEGFGFSNYYHTAFSKPQFDDFKFEVKNQPKIIEIKVRYL